MMERRRLLLAFVAARALAGETTKASERPGMVLIPASEFTMGRTRSTPDDSTKMRPRVLLDDRPPHKVWLDSYYLDAHEVTNARYAKFIAATGRRPPYHWSDGRFVKGEENLPVFNVSWFDADAYCRWAGMRLPTEAEWERAARAGKEGMSYPWGDKIEVGNARYNVETGPVAIGQFSANDFGLFDMVGNVSEWCADWFDREYYQSSPAWNPKGPETGLYKVVRGGAWSDEASRVTVFFRNWVRPNQTTPNIGFRCAR
jgi:iron(II)-dependent oxidoreductase